MKRPKLFLFHFAGGNCYSYQFLTPYLAAFDVVATELPGRGRRIKESLIHDFDAAAMDLYRQVSNSVQHTPFLIYGHSMGAYLALRVVNLLERAGKYPHALIVSGNAGPGLEKPDKVMRYQLDRPAFIEVLKELGGMPEELLENELLFEIFEPVLRADFEITERNRIAEEAAVHAPLFALMGSRENDVADIDNWARFTKGRFERAVLKGDHFFIRNHAQRMADIITRLYYHEVGIQG
ncbi:alpha/beta fold hydrolase [Chitinophaga sp.]|uniref:thioesterase II family protein n=1 Tax=Chitinophaga sp. TaxID=1869181 RepID=UPI0031D8B828